MNWLRIRLAEVQVAVMLLTRLPAGRLGGSVPTLGQAAWAFPLAGLVVGLLVAGVFAGGQMLGWQVPVAAGVAMVVGLIATGGLHEDGLGDVADGFGGGQTRARKLEIMKDSCLGSYGAIALVMALGLRWMMMAQVGRFGAIVALAVVSRGVLAAAVAAMPAAREDGLGRAAMGVGAARVAMALVVSGVALAIGLPVVMAAKVAMAMAMAVAALGWLAMRQIGGQSGDVLGAMQVVAEIAGWLVLAA